MLKENIVEMQSYILQPSMYKSHISGILCTLLYCIYLRNNLIISLWKQI